MLSFDKLTDKDIPLAFVYDSAEATKPTETIWFTPNFHGESQIISDDYKALIQEERFRIVKEFGLSRAEFNQVVDDIQNTKPMNVDYDRTMKKAYLEIKQTINNKLKKEITLDYSDKEYLRLWYSTEKPNTNRAIALFGSSGSGKSHATCQLILRNLHSFHVPRVYLISCVSEDDPSYEPLRSKYKERYEYISTNSQTTFDHRDYERGSIIILDDVDQTPNKKTRKNIQFHRDSLWTVGRHRSYNLISTNHIYAGFRLTQKTRSSSRWLGIFARSVPRVLLDVLEKDFAMSKPKRMDLLKKCQQDGRLTWISKSFPQFLLTPKRLILI